MPCRDDTYGAKPRENFDAPDGTTRSWRALLDDPRWSLAVALGLVLALALSRAALVVRRARLRARFARARAGEDAARALLEQRGFVVEAQQAPGALVLSVDGATTQHALRADYLVSRGRRRFVAEVKTGGVAPSLAHAPTRRQILEYCLAFDVDGALLVDVERRAVREIVAPRARASLLRSMALVTLGAAAGALLVIWLR